MKKELSVIVPAFNECKNIHNNLIKMCDFFKSLGYEYELIVINDGSTDNTLKKIMKASEKNENIKTLSYEENKGKGHAIVYGIKHAKGEYITFLDADLEISLESLKDFFKVIQEEDVNAVIGSKRHPDSEVNYPMHRKILSDCYYLLNKILFNLPVKDTQSGIKLYSSEILKKVAEKIVVKGYAFDLEILVNVNKLGYKIVEKPIKVNYSKGFGRIGLKTIFNILKDTLGIFYRIKIINYYDR